MKYKTKKKVKTEGFDMMGNSNSNENFPNIANIANIEELSNK